MSPLFWVAGAIAVLGAIGVVAARTPVHSVLALVVNLLGLAALYLSLDAEFLAWIQIIVYAGAIMILFIFVIALLTARKDPVEREKSTLEGQRELGLVAVIGSAVLFVAVALGASPASPGVEQLAEGFGTAAHFGRELLTTHVFPFELAAFALMAAVIGVVILVGRRSS